MYEVYDWVGEFDFANQLNTNAQSFPTESGLGNYVVLWLIEQARKLNLPYVYLGYWIAQSDKMAYKTNFRPIEALRKGRWEKL